MTVIKYKINNQTGRDLIANDWASAQTLREQTQAEEIAQLNWWSVIAQITNNDGSTTHAPVDVNGTPQMWDEATQSTVPYVDTTNAP
jgi:hypothetical protein